MFDLIKQTMMMGVGMAAMTKDKVEEYAREVADSAKLSREKGEEFVEEVKSRADKAREDFETTVQRVVNENLRKTDLPTREDIDTLSARIEKLEQTIAAGSD